MKKFFNKWEWLAIVILALCIATPAAYGAGGSPPNYWGADGSLKGGDEWTGEIVLVGQIADPSQAAVSPDSEDYTGIFPYDPVVSGVFIAKLENRKLGRITCSGQAFVEDPDDMKRYTYFHAIGDRLSYNYLWAEALQNFLKGEVIAALTNGSPQIGSNGYLVPFTVVLKEAGEESDNAAQLSGGLGNLKSPLFLSLKVTVVVP